MHLARQRLAIKLQRRCCSSLHKGIDDFQNDDDDDYFTRLIPKSPKIARLNNGILVASVENYSPVSQFSVTFKAGTRYETYNNLGVCHALRNAVSLSNKYETQFALTRTLQQMGAELKCSSSREHMHYTVKVDRDLRYDAFHLLCEASFMHDYRHWEICDQVLDLIRLDIARMTLGVRVIEMLHHTAFKRTVGHSLYMNEKRIPYLSSEMMNCYTCSLYNAASMIVTGVGVDHKELVSMAQELDFSGTAIKPLPSIYYGGEDRFDVPSSSITHAILASRSFSVCDKEYFATLVLQRILGVGPHIKFSNYNNTGRLQRVIQKVACHPIQASCLNISYSDCGLFGVYVIGHPHDIASAFSATAEELRNLTSCTFNENIMRTAKQSVKGYFMMELEKNENLLHEMSLQASYYAGLIDNSEILQAIENVSENDIRNVAAKIIKGNATYVAVGNLNKVPYLDELEL